MQKRHSVQALGAAIAVSLALGATPAARAADNFEIEVVMPLTGGGSFLGQGEQQSLQLAEKAVSIQHDVER